MLATQVRKLYVCCDKYKRKQDPYIPRAVEEEGGNNHAVEEESGDKRAESLHKHFTEHVSIDSSVGVAAASDEASAPSNSEIFRQDSEQGEASSHFSFVPRPLPLHGRPGSDDLGARLAILRCASPFPSGLFSLPACIVCMWRMGAGRPECMLP